MDFFKKYNALLLAGLIVGGVFFSIGYGIGRNATPSYVAGLDNKTAEMPTSVDFAPFWKAWNVISEKYVPASTTAKSVDEQDKVWGAIEGLASSLNDPYTVFLPPVENKLFESDIRGNFEGVGMEIMAQGGAVTVISPLKGSPAARAGIIAGDKIVRINDKETTNLTTEEAVQIIRGEKGTSVTFTIMRNGAEKPMEISVVRDVIDIPTISTKELENGIFVIELYSFSATSPNLFRGALREFIESESDKLILDLRGNPGGYLEAAIDMASWFLPPGKVVVREDFGEGASQKERVYRSKGYDIFNDNLKFAILVDGGSASASEILAGSLSEHGKATLVGDKTFGKGSVQELVSITPETSLKVTIARWLTPNGVSISEKGIVPEIQVKRTVKDIEASRDPQLDKAIEILIRS